MLDIVCVLSCSCPDGGCLGVRCHVTCPVAEAVFSPPPSPRCPALPSVFFRRTKHLKCFALIELACCSCSEICSETFAASYRFLWYTGLLRKWGVKVMKKLKVISDQKPGLIRGAVNFALVEGRVGGCFLFSSGFCCIFHGVFTSLFLFNSFSCHHRFYLGHFQFVRAVDQLLLQLG